MREAAAAVTMGWATGCHSLVAAFLAMQVEADDFLRRFDRLWLARGADHGNDRVLTSIRLLCESYACASPSGAGYRVSEDQLRHEIQTVAAHPPACE